jgi:glycosyltransferase involved in cell wall biosynthesis
LPKALIVSRYFPPLGSAGASIRLVKFIKYLSDLGWTFVVFTQDLEHTVVPEQPLSSFLLDELPADVVVERVLAPFSPAGHSAENVSDKQVPARIFRRIIGDSSLAWGLKVLSAGIKRMKKVDFDLVFSVTPPFTNALIAMLLSVIRRKPLVLDLKDDWVDSPTFLQKNRIRQRLEKTLESMIVRRSAAVITVTQRSYQLYKERYAHLSKEKRIHFIPNGCDLDEYRHLRSRERKIASERFLILSAAWGFKKDYRDITPFLLGLGQFCTRYSEMSERIEVILLGNSLSAEYDSLLSQLNLQKIVQCTGALSRDKFVEQLWKADLLLLVQPVDNTTAISGTLYEYWATGKAPILLISETGASSTLVEENRVGQHFHYDHIDDIAHYIETIFLAYEAGQPVWIEQEGVEHFDRRKLAGHLDKVLRSTLSPTG